MGKELVRKIAASITTMTQPALLRGAGLGPQKLSEFAAGRARGLLMD